MVLYARSTGKNMWKPGLTESDKIANKKAGKAIDFLLVIWGVYTVVVIACAVAILEYIR